MLSIAKEIQRWITKRLDNVYNSFGPLRLFQRLPLTKKEKNSSAQTPSVLNYTINNSNRRQVYYLHGAQIRHLFALLHESSNWPTPSQWCAHTVCVLLMFLIFPRSGYNTRVKAMHIVNARPWTETLIAIIKFVLRNKIAGRVSVIQYVEFGNSTYVYFYI